MSFFSLLQARLEEAQRQAAVDAAAATAARRVRVERQWKGVARAAVAGVDAGTWAPPSRPPPPSLRAPSPDPLAALEFTMREADKLAVAVAVRSGGSGAGGVGEVRSGQADPTSQPQDRRWADPTGEEEDLALAIALDLNAPDATPSASPQQGEGAATPYSTWRADSVTPQLGRLPLLVAPRSSSSRSLFDAPLLSLKPLPSARSTGLLVSPPRAAAVTTPRRQPRQRSQPLPSPLAASARARATPLGRQVFDFSVVESLEPPANALVIELEDGGGGGAPTPPDRVPHSPAPSSVTAPQWRQQQLVQPGHRASSLKSVGLQTLNSRYAAVSATTGSVGGGHLSPLWPSVSPAPSAGHGSGESRQWSRGLLAWLDELGTPALGVPASAALPAGAVGVWMGGRDGDDSSGYTRPGDVSRRTARLAPHTPLASGGESRLPRSLSAAALPLHPLLTPLSGADASPARAPPHLSSLPHHQRPRVEPSQLMREDHVPEQQPAPRSLSVPVAARLGVGSVRRVVPPIWTTPASNTEGSSSPGSDRGATSASAPVTPARLAARSASPSSSTASAPGMQPPAPPLAPLPVRADRDRLHTLLEDDDAEAADGGNAEEDDDEGGRGPSAAGPGRRRVRTMTLRSRLGSDGSITDTAGGGAFARVGGVRPAAANSIDELGDVAALLNGGFEGSNRQPVDATGAAAARPGTAAGAWRLDLVQDARRVALSEAARGGALMQHLNRSLRSTGGS